MENKISSREYIRTKDGKIGVIGFPDDEDEENMFKQRQFEWYSNGKSYDLIKENEIIKHSKNIIDLIEAGDILKYKLKCMDALVSFKIGQVLEITDPRSGNKALSIGFYNIKQLEILKVITKEEFDSIGDEV